jgi:hypothetical protein
MSLNSNPDSDSDSNTYSTDTVLVDDNFIGPFTDKVIKDLITEIKKEKNIKRIQENIIDPVLLDINNRYFPHMVTLITLLIMIVLLLVLILIFNFSDKNKQNTQTYNLS